MKKYIPAEIEKKWQKRWREEKLYLTDLSKPEKKYYCLVELPYTSGVLHIGHWFTFSKGDILARFKKMQGFNVILPNGYDTFGLPAENAAIKNKMHPKEWTYQNIKIMREQFETMGTMIDWEKSVTTCDPKYYKWNQWIFLRMLEKGLAYQGQTISNWCPSCQTVLADENVEAGKCWRCGSEVIKKEVKQWFLKITDYADKLIWPKDDKYAWPKSLKIAQNDWIGRSEGMEIQFPVSSFQFPVKVYTTRPETTDAATFLVLAPEHPFVSKLTTIEQKASVNNYLKQAAKKSEQERKENKEKSGVFIGSYAINPVNKKQIPIWIADYVLLEYGTGAIMAVPGEDERDKEFAQKFKLPIEKSSLQAKPKGTKKVHYHLHDWSISRQRYWGTPIPIIYCRKCWENSKFKIQNSKLGTAIIDGKEHAIIPVPEKDLPVVLPDEVDYTPGGDAAPLARADDWVNVKCPKCGKMGKREVETMDGFIDNSWYFFRYLDPENERQIFDKKIVNDWMPIEIYIGGSEHTYGHALYSRFFSKFFKDLGLVDFDEYTLKRVHHGVVLGPDGHRMSKSRGNVVDPDKQAAEFGADAVRVYLSFMGPVDIVTPWVPEGLNGVYRFLQRAWKLQERLGDTTPSKPDRVALNKAVQKVTADLEDLANNTAIAALMKWLNYLSRKEAVSRQEYQTFLLLLAPLAPYITEELWQVSACLPARQGFSRSADQKGNWSIHQQSWPQVDESALQSDEVVMVVQINGRVRETLLMPIDIANDRQQVQKRALASPKVQKFVGKKGLDSEAQKVVFVPGKVINFLV